MASWSVVATLTLSCGNSLSNHSAERFVEASERPLTLRFFRLGRCETAEATAMR